MPDQAEQPAPSVWEKIKQGYAAWREMTRKKKKKKTPTVDTGRTTRRPVVPQPNAQQLKAIADAERRRREASP